MAGVKLSLSAAQKVADAVRAIANQRRQPLPAGEPDFQPPQLYRGWFKITGSTPADAIPRNRWLYSVVEVVKTSGGYGGWAVKSGGVSGQIGYNGMERPNVASTGTSPTRIGTGQDIDHDFFADPLTVYPIQADCVVEGTLHLIEGDNGEQSREVWFAAPNHAWGDPCPRSPATMATLGDDIERTTTDATNDWQACRSVEGVGVVGAKLYAQTGTYYDHSVSSPDLKAQMREVRFDKYGRCYSISVEAEFVVDTPEAC